MSYVFPFSFAARKEAALLVADGPSVQMALLWMKLLGTLPDCTLAFPELDGSQVRHLERKIETAAKSIGHTLPRPTAFRKSLEIRNKRLSGPMREAGLTHSLGTAQQYYQAPTVSDVYSAFSVMQDIIGGARAGSPTTEDMPSQEEESEEGEKRKKAERTAPRYVGGEERDSPERGQKERKRKKGKERAQREGQGEIEEECWLPSPKKFSQEEMELITKFFRRQKKAQKNFPTSMECRDFVAIYKSEFQDRTVKDIYDKCRNIAGR